MAATQFDDMALILREERGDATQYICMMHMMCMMGRHGALVDKHIAHRQSDDSFIKVWHQECEAAPLARNNNDSTRLEPDTAHRKTTLFRSRSSPSCQLHFFFALLLQKCDSIFSAFCFLLISHFTFRILLFYIYTRTVRYRLVQVSQHHNNMNNMECLLSNSRSSLCGMAQISQIAELQNDRTIEL